MHLPKFRIATACLTATLAAAALLSGPAIATAQAKPSGLPPAIREQMDAASAKFTSAQADMKQELFTKLVRDTETQTGQIYVQRKGGSTQMGIRLMPPDAKPGAAPAQIVVLRNNLAQSFNPGTNQIDEFSAAGKNQALAQTIMALAFGASGTDLAKAWTVTDLGSESIADGNQTVKTEKLDLVSNDPTIRNNYTHITIWIDPVRDVSLKQVSFNASNGSPTGDTRTVYYSNIRLNQPVDAATFAIKCKGKCTVVSH
jgi:outer membrane lipoprotein-sorting protein